MVNVHDVFPSNWIKAGDLKGREVKVVIARIAVEEVGSEPKPVVYFQGKDKGLVLNKTNANTIADMYGPETDGWIGRPIVIFPTQTDFQGRQVAAIRVQLMTPNEISMAAQAPAEDPRPPVPATGPVDDLDDDIPFIVWGDYRFDKGIRA